VIVLPFAGSAVVHGLFMGLGVTAALIVYASEQRRRGLTDSRLWTIAAFAITFGAVGARLLTWDFTRQASIVDWWVTGDRSILAGLVGAWIGVHLGKRIVGYRPSTGDLFAPAVALGMAIGRVGCLLTELPGTPTGGHWGMVLHPSRRRTPRWTGRCRPASVVRLRDRVPGHRLRRAVAVYMLKDDVGVWRSLTALIGHDELLKWLEIDPDSIANRIADSAIPLNLRSVIKTSLLDLLSEQASLSHPRTADLWKNICTQCCTSASTRRSPCSAGRPGRWRSSSSPGSASSATGERAGPASSGRSASCGTRGWCSPTWRSCPSRG
jgi:hypothetical protein